ncbi:MAG: B12-binding domain-containing protein [Ilumatobacteraceae bacterium]
MQGIDDDPLPLQAAADELGVHYQTAYRWIRNGRLPARLVEGKYIVTRAELADLKERRRAPGSPNPPGPARLERQAARMHRALLDGDEATARSISQRLIDEGTSVVELIQSLLVPALRHIGQAWHDGDLTIWVEHRASAIVERILGELVPNPRGRRRGTAMVAAVAGDRHSLPTTMAAVALREANWRVHHLGADMPSEELIRFCDEHDIDVAVISLANPDPARRAAETAQRIRDCGTPTIVGGPGRSLDQLIDAAHTAAADERVV